MTGDPGSYAMRTIVERKPRIIGEVIRSNTLNGSAVRRLEALGDEIRKGYVADPAGRGGYPERFQADEAAVWGREIARWRGGKWLEIPWYFAEAYFYLRLLLACGYYGNSTSRFDPFRPQKERELTGSGGGLALGRDILRGLDGMEADEGRAAFLLHTSLWGNRVDLSNFDVAARDRGRLFEPEADALLIDHTAAAVKAALGAAAVDMILDNAGPELVSDLLLADFLLRRGRTDRVVLHVKQSPFFVSDAMTGDVLSTADAFLADSDPRLRDAGGRLRSMIRAGRLEIRDHYFWNGPLHFSSLRPEILESFGRADLLIFKGDANYRRLLEDRKWDTDVDLEKTACALPVPYLALRTMKSEIVADVSRQKAAELFRQDPEWRVNGKRGIVRLCRARARLR